MQTRNKILDDLSRLMNSALGVAQGAKNEAETAMKSLLERWLADHDLVTREEFEAVQAMALKARQENEALQARIEAIEARLDMPDETGKPAGRRTKPTRGSGAAKQSASRTKKPRNA